MAAFTQHHCCIPETARNVFECLISRHATAQVHEAIMRAPSDDVPDGTVLQEFRKGFRIGSTLLRPAMVQVRHLDAQLKHC